MTLLLWFIVGVTTSITLIGAVPQLQEALRRAKSASVGLKKEGAQAGAAAAVPKPPIGFDLAGVPFKVPEVPPRPFEGSPDEIFPGGLI